MEKRRVSGNMKEALSCEELLPSSLLMTRRHFLGRFALASLFSGSIGATYALHEAKDCQVERVSITLRNLPASFDGTTVAFVTDTHHGPGVPLSYLERVVAMTNALNPDIVTLGGDYVQRARYLQGHGSHRPYIAPGVAVLAGLRAPLGRFAVLGNHDRKESAMLTRRALADHGLVELTNTGVWLERGGSRLRLCGVDDYATGHPNLRAALGDTRLDDACLLLSHNPDFVERLRDPRVDLVLSGHTHGGQVVLPLFGPPVTASRYGRKYVQGLVQGPTARVYVSRGVGTIGPPIRFGAPPEVTLITLRQSLQVCPRAAYPATANASS